MANVTETSVWNPRTGRMETVAGADDPTTFKPLSAVDVDPEATIWDPTTGTKFRFMGFDLAGSIAGEYIFRDNTAGTVIYRTYLRANSPKTVALGAGVLS